MSGSEQGCSPHTTQMDSPLERPARSARMNGLVFDSMAASYDAWYDTLRGRTYDTLEKKVVDKLLPPVTRGNELLDVGCGTGHWSAFFAGQGFRVTGVDVSEKMINIARSKVIPGAAFQVADADELPFEDGWFDVVAAITTLEFVSSPEGVVKEMVRCTKHPGGAILAGVLNPDARVNRDRKAKGKEPYASARFFSPSELGALLSPYGKPQVEVAAFVPRSAWALPLAPLLDFAARSLRLPCGALVAGRLIL